MFSSFQLNEKHTILYKLDNLNNFISINEIYVDKWNCCYVRMPCSPLSFYPLVKDGKKSLSQRWKIIKESLKCMPKDIYDVKKSIISYNSRFENHWDFEVLIQLFENELNTDACSNFFNVTYPGMVELALNLPELVTEPIPLLQSGTSSSISLTQLQIGSLLANAFFCTFPRRNSRHSASEFRNYPLINFSSLFSSNNSAASDTRKIEKLKCILHYFHHLVTERPDGVVTFTRRCLTEAPCLDDNEVKFKDVSLVVSVGSIFSLSSEAIKIDFANEFVGGGVLGRGCVQEEILFATHPELLAACLFTERLGPLETLLVRGAQLYSRHEGYCDSFKCLGPAEIATAARDRYGRVRTTVSMMDAGFVREDPSIQYRLSQIDREVAKAYCGFMDSRTGRDEDDDLPSTVATGNWGCGAFGGDYQLKFVIQAMVCAGLRKDMIYHTFDDEPRREEISAVVRLLQSSGCTVGLMRTLLGMFVEERGSRSLFAYLGDRLLPGQ